MITLNREEIKRKMEIDGLRDQLQLLNQSGMAPESLYLGTLENGSIVFGAPHATVRMLSGMSKYFSESKLGLFHKISQKI